MTHHVDPTMEMNEHCMYKMDPIQIIIRYWLALLFFNSGYSRTSYHMSHTVLSFRPTKWEYTMHATIVNFWHKKLKIGEVAELEQKIRSSIVYC